MNISHFLSIFTLILLFFDFFIYFGCHLIPFEFLKKIPYFFPTVFFINIFLTKQFRLRCDIDFKISIHLISHTGWHSIKSSDIWSRCQNMLTFTLYFNFLDPTAHLYSSFHKFKSWTDIWDLLKYLSHSLHLIFMLLK